MLMDRSGSQLLLIDMQERLDPVIENREEIARNAGILLRAAAALSVPVTVSEQYPAGLGHTLPQLAALVPEDAVLAKRDFSCWQDAGLRARLSAFKRPQIVVAGVEAHVCVNQTVMDLLAANYEVFVVADASGSRRALSRDTALARQARAGAHIVTTEMAVFEWLRTSTAPEFRDLSRLIR